MFPSRQIFLTVGPLEIHWYGLMYLCAFLLAWKLIPALARKKEFVLSQEDVSNILFAGVLGVLLGGRLGYVVFYGAEYYGDHPWDILKVWEGGMASHGGFLGVFIAMLIVRRKLMSKITIWQLADILVIPAAIGLAFGRVGNFINLELYGPVTNLPWAITIPGIEGLRHPTPLYAVMKNIVVATTCFLTFMKSNRDGMTFAAFLILYSFLRILVEEVRIETAPGFEMGVMELTRGQALTIPLLVIGIAIFFARRRSSDIC
jgi:phosphatidylglycerol---prolipoprotein diacylglyceryl transferase